MKVENLSTKIKSIELQLEVLKVILDKKEMKKSTQKGLKALKGAFKNMRPFSEGEIKEAKAKFREKL